MTKKILKAKVKPTDIMPRYSSAIKTVVISDACESSKNGAKFGCRISIISNIADVVKTTFYAAFILPILTPLLTLILGATSNALLS